jgi:uncharacterized SAM-binding protein YcdF (DUF218 family)
VPVGQILLRPLESRYPVAPPMPVPAGIIVLGGGERIDSSARWGRPELNDGADRFTAALALAHRYPKARVIFTGGSGAVRDSGSAATGASVARDFFAEQGLAAERLILEPRSRNTTENASHSFALIRPGPGDHWELVLCRESASARYCAARISGPAGLSRYGPVGRSCEMVRRCR